MPTTRVHLEHLASKPHGIHVPLLYADEDTAGDRSPAAELDAHGHRRILADEHPYYPGRTIIRIVLDGHPCWISGTWLAHRFCEDCVDIWADIGTEYYQAHGPIWIATHLEDGHHRGDVLILHSTDELPETLGQAS